MKCPRVKSSATLPSCVAGHVPLAFPFDSLFEFVNISGGSTVIAVFPKGSVTFDADLLENSEKALETVVKVTVPIPGHRLIQLILLNLLTLDRWEIELVLLSKAGLRLVAMGMRANVFRQCVLVTCD